MPNPASRCSIRHRSQTGPPPANRSPGPKKWRLPSLRDRRPLPWHLSLRPWRGGTQAAPRFRARAPSTLGQLKKSERSMPTRRWRRRVPPGRPRKPAAGDLPEANRLRLPSRPLPRLPRRLRNQLPPQPQPLLQLLHGRLAALPLGGTVPPPRRPPRRIPAPVSRSPARPRVMPANGGSKPRRVMAMRMPRLLPPGRPRRRILRPSHPPKRQLPRFRPGKTTATGSPKVTTSSRPTAEARRDVDSPRWPPR